MNNLLNRIENCNLYTLRFVDGKIYIHMLGYYYDAGFSQEDDNKNWRYVMYCGYDMPLSEYLAGTEEDKDGWEEQYVRWIDDYTENEVKLFFKSSFAPIPLHYTEITEDVVSDNVYIATIY